MIEIVLVPWRLFGLLYILIHTMSTPVFAQEMMEDVSCPICGMMRGPMTWLGVALVVAVIAVLVALTIFLVRRSRGPKN